MSNDRVTFVNEVNSFISESKRYLSGLLNELDWTEEDTVVVLKTIKNEEIASVDFSGVPCSSESIAFDELPQLVKREKQMSFLDILAQERDMKRRRVSYKGRVHTKHKSHNEILKEVIAQQMEMLSDTAISTEDRSSVASSSFKAEEKIFDVSHLRVDNPHLAWKFVSDNIDNNDNSDSDNSTTCSYNDLKKRDRRHRDFERDYSDGKTSSDGRNKLRDSIDVSRKHRDSDKRHDSRKHLNHSSSNDRFRKDGDSRKHRDKEGDESRLNDGFKKHGGRHRDKESRHSSLNDELKNHDSRHRDKEGDESRLNDGFKKHHDGRHRDKKNYHSSLNDEYKKHRDKHKRNQLNDNDNFNNDSQSSDKHSTKKLDRTRDKDISLCHSSKDYKDKRKELYDKEYENSYNKISDKSISSYNKFSDNADSNDTKNVMNDDIYTKSMNCDRDVSLLDRCQESLTESIDRDAALKYLLETIDKNVPLERRRCQESFSVTMDHDSNILMDRCKFDSDKRTFESNEDRYSRKKKKKNRRSRSESSDGRKRRKKDRRSRDTSPAAHDR